MLRNTYLALFARTQVLSVNQYLTFLLHSKHNTFHCDEHLSSTSEYDCCDLEFVRQNNRNIRCFDCVLGLASHGCICANKVVKIVRFLFLSLLMRWCSFDLMIRYTRSQNTNTASSYERSGKRAARSDEGNSNEHDSLLK